MRCKNDWHAFHIVADTCDCGTYRVTVTPVRPAEPNPYLTGYEDGYAERSPITDNDTYMRGHQLGANTRRIQKRR